MNDTAERNTACVLLYEGAHTAETGSDYTLPDYLPDIRKILRVTGVPRITGKYMNGDHVELEGTVQTEILYMAEEGTVHCMPVSAALEQSIAVSGLDENCVLSVDVRTENTVCRLSGPRRLSVKHKIRSTVRAFAERGMLPVIHDAQNPAAAANLCTEHGSVHSCTLYCADTDDLRYSEDVGTGGETVTEILSCAVSPCVTDVRSADGSVTCKGEYLIRLFCACAPTEGGQPVCHAFFRRVPFSETLEADSVSAGAVCLPDLTVTGCTAALAEEGRMCAVDFSAELSVTCFSDAECAPVTDAFVPSYETKCLSEEISVFRPKKTLFGTVSVPAPLRYDSAEEVTEVIDCTGTVLSCDAAVADGRLHLSGNMELSSIVRTKEGRCFPVSAQTPFRADADAGDLAREPDASPFLSASVVIPECKCRLDTAAHTVNADAELAFSVFSGCQEICRTVTDISFSAEALPAPSTDDAVILCYPMPGESLWEIAKHYRLPPDELRRANRFPAEKKSTAPEDRVLIIPVNTII